MTFWFLRGLRQGVVTTRYPAPGWADHDAWAGGLPSPPAPGPASLDGEQAERLAGLCPPGALVADGAELQIDLGACTGCGRCIEASGGALVASNTFELASRERDALVHPAPPTRSGSSGDSDVSPVAAELRRRSLALFGRSLHIRTVDTGSCAACESEIRLLGSPHYDLHRLGLFFTPAPRHADVLLVTGPAVRAADTLLLAAYEATPDPKAVIAVGACALGGVYPEDNLVHGSVDRVVPVDAFIPGCPPSPLALLHGLLVALGRLEERVGGLGGLGGLGGPPDE